jgi:hypothetical protein
MQFSFRSVNARGAVLHSFGFWAADLTEAYAVARHFAASIVAGAPEGKDWTGWCVDILDGIGRHQISLPMIDAQPDAPASLGRCEP